MKSHLLFWKQKKKLRWKAHEPRPSSEKIFKKERSGVKEKELMLTSILGCSRTDLYAKDVVLTPDQEQKLIQMQKRRKQGEPLQYILGECDFIGIPIKVDERVFIPRPETEILVDAIIERIKQFSKDYCILDLGTGSGNIAVSLAKYVPRSTIDAVDISFGALEVAKENAKKNNVGNKIHFIHADMIDYLENVSRKEKYDVIVSNPPYIPSSQIGLLPEDVRREPQVALNGGFDGLEFYRIIIKNSVKTLKEDGFLFFEMGDGQKNALEMIFDQSECFRHLHFIKDYTKVDRIVVARKIVLKDSKSQEDEISLTKN